MIILATGNINKLRELEEVVQLLKLRNLPVRRASDFGPMPDPEETENTLMGNAILKFHDFCKALQKQTPQRGPGFFQKTLDFLSKS